MEACSKKPWFGDGLVQCSLGAFNSLARSVELSTTSKVTPSW
jgi:hypothetical protein